MLHIYIIMFNSIIFGIKKTEKNIQKKKGLEKELKKGKKIELITEKKKKKRVKKKDEGINVGDIFEKIKDKYKNQPINTEDGLKIEFDKDWVHLRTSNTEPIIRIYAESNFETTADNIAKRIMQDIQELGTPSAQ